MDIDFIINTDETDELEQLKAAVRDLRRRSHDVRAQVTFEGTDAARFARDAVERGTDLIVAAGGDGTVHKVVNGIFAASGGVPDPAAAPRLGVVPIGTGNDLAGFLEIPALIAEAVEVAVYGTEMEVDVATLNGRYFVNVSTGGLGAEATEETSDRAKKLLGSFAYFVTGVRKFATLQPSSAKFSSSGETVFDGEFVFFAVGNGGRTGGGNHVTPRADLCDGLLDVCILKASSPAELLRVLPDVRAGNHLENGHVVYRQLSHLMVSPRGELSVNVDGEPIDDPQLEYAVLPRALRLAAPPVLRRA